MVLYDEFRIGLGVGTGFTSSLGFLGFFSPGYEDGFADFQEDAVEGFSGGWVHIAGDPFCTYGINIGKFIISNFLHS